MAVRNQKNKDVKFTDGTYRRKFKKGFIDSMNIRNNHIRAVRRSSYFKLVYLGLDKKYKLIDLKNNKEKLFSKEAVQDLELAMIPAYEFHDECIKLFN